MRRPTRRVGALLVALAAAAAVMTGCTGTPASVALAEPDAGVQLFQRPWTAIAEECETTIGPAGFAWVLTSPPQEHITGDAWWTSYQPVSYELDSKLGSPEEFAAMVSRCDAAGVDVIADAVINHMAGIDGGVGFAGTAFTHHDYPGLYASADFHHCGLTPGDDIEDYSSREQVQTCELVNLSDLDTGSDYVRATIAAYLMKLLDLGVSGFRIDAAKHMAAEDVQAIVDLLPDDAVILSEVIRGSGSEPVQPEEYLDAGQVFEFQYARDLGPSLAAGIINDPVLGEERPSHVPSADAVTFVDNHDTERGDAAVTYRDGGLYVIANALLLADDYGTPVVYSGYAFSDREAGAPQGDGGRVEPWTCADVDGPRDSYDDGEGVCTEAWTSIAGMLEWRAVAGAAPRREGYSEGSVYAFDRDGRALLAVNPDQEEASATVTTTLPDGDYCDVILAGARIDADGACPDGGIVSVAGGQASIGLGPLQAVAIHLGSRIP